MERPKNLQTIKESNRILGNLKNQVRIVIEFLTGHGHLHKYLY